MTPEIGQQVIYTLSDGDATEINRRRSHFAASLLPDDDTAETGYIGHVGNYAYSGQELPAVIVASWGGSTVNLQVTLDGNDHYWATSRQEGNQPGQWKHRPGLGAELAGEARKLASHWPSFKGDAGVVPTAEGGAVPLDPSTPLYDQLTAENAAAAAEQASVPADPPAAPAAEVPQEDAPPAASTAPDATAAPADAAPDAAPDAAADVAEDAPANT